MTRGLLVQANYEFGRALTSQRPTLRPGYAVQDAARSGEYVTNLTAWSVAHALKFTWVVELPFGRGKAWGGGAGRWLDALIGGWEWDGVGRIQSGRLVDFGNYRLVGMTEEDLQRMFKIYQRPDADGKPRIYMLPQDVIDNSILAVYGASATSPTGYAGAVPTGRYFARAGGPDCVQAYSGQCAPLNHLVRGPRFSRVDMAVVKRISVARTMRIELRMELLNVFDAVNFVPRAEVASAPGGWEVVAAARDASAQNPGGRITQFEARVSW